MAVDSQTADVLDALYDLFAANATIAAAVTAGTVRLFDGPPTQDWGAPVMLSVGGRWEVDADDPEIPVAWDWETSGLDPQVTEIIEVPVTVAGLDGVAENMRALRRQVITIWAAAAKAARTSTLSLGNVMWCLPSSAIIRQIQTTEGAECVISFSVRVRTQI